MGLVVLKKKNELKDLDQIFIKEKIVQKHYFNLMIMVDFKFNSENIYSFLIIIN